MTKFLLSLEYRLNFNAELIMHLIKKISFMIAYLIIPLPFIGHWLGGWYNFLAFYIIFIAIPLIDVFFKDSTNPNDGQEIELKKAAYFKQLVYAYPLIQGLSLVAATYLVSGQPHLSYEWLGFTLSFGLVSGGIGLTLAHELMHKNNRLSQLLSKGLLVMVCYGHFIIEHVRGHHVRVATPNDPASARLGESLYYFLPRSIIGAMRSAWQLETARLKQKNLPLSSTQNQFYWIIGVPVTILIACYIWGGLSAALFFLLQSAMAIILLETVNYIEHYGLERQKLANGNYERVTDSHSWNANHLFSNMLLFHLQRHSDHHMYGAKPYQVLKHIQTSPQLPMGYLGMIFLAFFPPLWQLIMDKRVINYYKKVDNEHKKHCVL